MKKILKVTLIISLVVIFLFSLSILTFFIITKDAKLDKNKLLNHKSNVTFYNDNNEIIEDSYCKENNESIDINVIPEQLKQAFISTEDRKFYKHKGVDYKRLVGATLKNIKHKSFKEGASTISQQLIKNTHLTNKKTIKRKLSEIKLTYELEKKYTKNDILELYLNTIYFGENSFGIKRAAQIYFDKNVDALNISESAMLAGIIKAPSNYSPFVSNEKCLKRRNLVLKNMKKLGYITLQEYDEAILQPLPNKIFKNKNSSYLAECFKEINFLQTLTNFDLQDCKIYTFLDNKLQNFIDDVNFEQTNKFKKQIVVIENLTNGVKAFINTGLNQKRMPGSIIKPLISYAPALDLGIISTSSKILDEKTNFNGYTPENYKNKYYGYTTVKNSLANSLNIPAIKILNMVGIPKSNEYLKKMNINLDKNDNNLSIALGGLTDGLEFINIVNAYTTFANDGYFKTQKFIKKIIDSNNKIIYNCSDDTSDTSQVFSEETSYLINDCLMYATKNGTAKKLNDLNYDVCAKTGTVGNLKGNTDSNIIAYTKEITLGCSYYSDTNNLMPNNISGGSYPASLAKIIFNKIYNNFSAKPFIKPKNIIELSLDKISFEKDNILEIASANTPINYITKEIFNKKYVPRLVSKRFENPTIENAEIIIKNNIVNLQLCVADYYDYSVYYELNGKNKLLFDTCNGERLKDITFKPQIDGNYKFFILPYLNINGIKTFGDTLALPTIKFKLNKIIFDDADNEIIKKDDWWKIFL